MSIAAELLICVFAQFISFFYYDGKYKTKRPLRQLFAMFFAAFALQFAAGFLNVSLFGINVFSAVAFLFSNILILFACYDISLYGLLFEASLLCVLKISSELIVSGIVSLVLLRSFRQLSLDIPVSLIREIASEILFFALVIILLKLQKIGNRGEKINRLSAMLLIFPALSLVMMIMFIITVFRSASQSGLTTLLVITSLLLLSCNILLFAVYERVVKILVENSEYLVTANRLELQSEHYAELERRKENTDILLHDIKNHLNTIKALAKSEGAEEVEKYVDSVIGASNLQYHREFSKNRLVDVIVNRYCELFSKNRTDFFADIRSVPFEKIDESDLTSLLDNLLKNAFEAAAQSEKKSVSLMIDRKNDVLVRFIVENSCNIKPKYDENGLVTTKPDKDNHGFGLKIINRIASKYGGKAAFSFDEKTNTFKSTVILMIE